jgi:predicted ATPase
MTLWTLGYPDQALKWANEAVEFAQALAHPHSLVGAESFLAVVRQVRREPHLVQKVAERLIALSAEHGFTLWLAYATFLRGSASAEQGRNEDGIQQMQEGLAASRATGAELLRPYHLCLLAEACIEIGRLDDGLRALMEALAAADQHENRESGAEIHRLKGALLLKQNTANAREAERCFRIAIEVSRCQSAKSLELRATMSLARLLVTQGKRDEARAMLTEIFGWFTEGFDTADLKDAKALLDELSA